VSTTHSIPWSKHLLPRMIAGLQSGCQASLVVCSDKVLFSSLLPAIWHERSKMTFKPLRACSRLGLLQPFPIILCNYH
jgi:hypothetical protein